MTALAVQHAQSTSLQTIHDLRMAKEALFNRTMTKIAGAATTATNNAEAFVNHTAIKLMSAKHSFYNSLAEHATKLASRREYTEERWQQWRNKTAEHLKPIGEMLETMQDAVKTKVVAKVDLMHRKGEIMSDFFKTMFGSVVDMVHKTKVNIAKHKNQKEQQTSETKDAILVHAGKAVSTPHLAYTVEASNVSDYQPVPILYVN